MISNLPLYTHWTTLLPNNTVPLVFRSIQVATHLAEPPPEWPQQHTPSITGWHDGQPMGARMSHEGEVGGGRNYCNFEQGRSVTEKTFIRVAKQGKKTSSPSPPPSPPSTFISQVPLPFAALFQARQCKFSSKYRSGRLDGWINSQLFLYLSYLARWWQRRRRRQLLPLLRRRRKRRTRNCFGFFFRYKCYGQ